MIVPDNSVLVPLFTDHVRTTAAQDLFAIDAAWRLPAIWRYEFTNVLATLVRNRRIDTSVAMNAIDVARIAIGKSEVAVDQHEVIRFAHFYGLSGYDAQYVATANEYGILVITDDRALAKRARGHAIHLDEFLERHR